MTPPDAIPTRAYPPCAPGSLRPGAAIHRAARPPFGEEADDVVVDLLDPVLGNAVGETGPAGSGAARPTGDGPDAVAGDAPAPRRVRPDATDAMLAVGIYTMACVLGWSLVGVLVALWWRP